MTRCATSLGFCTERATGELIAVVPPDAPFWELADQSLEAQKRPRWSGPARMIGLAAAFAADRMDVASEVFDDGGSPGRRVRDPGRACEHARRSAGGPRDRTRSRSSPSEQRSRSTRRLSRTWCWGRWWRRDRCRRSWAGARTDRGERRIASELDLPMMNAFLADAERVFALELAAARGERQASRPLLERAEPTSRRPWPWPRGVSSSTPPSARAGRRIARACSAAGGRIRFPAGLILEILCSSRHDVRRAGRPIPRLTVANGFRYYDHPWSDADADTVGVFLRLLPHRTRPRACAPPWTRCWPAWTA